MNMHLDFILYLYWIKFVKVVCYIVKCSYLRNIRPPGTFTYSANTLSSEKYHEINIKISPYFSIMDNGQGRAKSYYLF
jgi:hypothetical protein